MDVKEYIQKYNDENNLDILKNYLTMVANNHNIGWKGNLEK